MSTKTLELEIEALLNSIHRRVGVTQAKSLLERSGYNTSLGWDALIAELKNDKEQHLTLRKALKVSLEDLVKYGSRLFECYDIDNASVTLLMNLLDSKSPPKFEISDLIDLDKDKKNDDFILYAKECCDSGVTYYFYHTCHCTEIIPISKEAFKDSFLEYQDFDKVTATINTRKTFYNSLHYDNSKNRIYLFIDRAEEVGLRNLREVKNDFKQRINDLFYNEFDSIFFNNRVNLFNKVDLLYDGTKGIVNELKFVCPSGTVRYEVLSNRVKHEDLREELYHKAGMEKIDYAIEPFHISLKFEEGYLCLLGQKVMTNNIEPKPLTEGMIKSSFSRNHYLYLLKVLDEA
ncbi:hypothetical protein [Aliivibrio fischeri]|uniref:hypothetical protein n=1 Tax=Aliivibrio fischeri TaxID=668 RepID=UPI0007C59FBA|nr:hypothetical protein [Aliivibrio fischeri]